MGGFCFSLLLKPKEYAFILNNPFNVLEYMYVYNTKSIVYFWLDLCLLVHLSLCNHTVNLRDEKATSDF